MFVRFVVGADDAHHKALTGIINDAEALKVKGQLSPEEARDLEEIHKWLNRNLPVPPFKSSKWPKTAVAWFKDSAGEPLRRMWDLVAILREHDVPVRMLKSKEPGKVLYEDDYQVVVSQWSRI
jgi:hypothetical protein